MDTFSPEFSGYWQSERELAGETTGTESASSRQSGAIAQGAGRVVSA